jgi:hypothetical protein
MKIAWPITARGRMRICGNERNNLSINSIALISCRLNA